MIYLGDIVRKTEMSFRLVKKSHGSTEYLIEKLYL